MRLPGSVQLVHAGKPSTLWLLTTPELSSYVITCNTGIKTGKNWWAIQLTVLSRVDQLKDIV